MRKSKVLEKFHCGKAARICSLGHFLPFFVRYASHYYYDGVWLDLEHRTMNDREVQALLAFCHKYDIDCMVRPPTIERNRLYRYLEDGASGFLIPFASGRDVARQVVEAVKFPPFGNRGLDGAGLDGDYGLSAWHQNSTYTTDANRETFIIAQIETPEAVSVANEIAAVKGIDGLFVGTADLGLRLDAYPGSEIRNLEAAIEQVSVAAKRHEKAWGAASASLEAMLRYRSMGAKIIPWGSDFGLCQVLANCSAQLNSALHE